MNYKNIYVGNRYVPLPCGTWDNTKLTQYESLSIVEYGGVGYTSKKTVPTGIDISDINYWVKTFDYNSQISNLNNELNSFKSSTNSSFTSLGNSLLQLQYIKPSIQVTSSLTNLLFKYGQSLNNTTLSTTWLDGSEPINEVYYKRNGNIIRTNMSPIGNSDSYVDIANITDNATYTAEINDGVNNFVSNEIKIDFVYPMFFGSLANTIVTPTQNDVATLTERIAKKGQVSFDFNVINNVPCIIYPSAYGDLTSIMQDNGINLIDSFNKVQFGLTADDNHSVTYFGYMFENVVTDDMTLTINF